MATFTTFCFGTGESQNMAKKNIISQFSEACGDPKLVIDGPGMLGKEVEPNTQHGVREIKKWLLEQQDEHNNLNLTGFSRGSVTCIRIANELKQLERQLRRKERVGLTDEDTRLLARLRGLDIHIFANDPVAGLGDKTHMEGRVIPSNVKSYVATFQMDEMRRDFKPQDMTRAIIASPYTQVSMLPMYGNHSDCTKIKKDSMDSGPTIAWYLTYEFLTQHGSQFENLPQIVNSNMEFSQLDAATPAVILEQFAKFHQQREPFLASGKKVKAFDGIPVARKERSLNNHLDYYVRQPEFFVNRLERELFKVTYPQVFNYLFEKGVADPRFPFDPEIDHHQQRLQQLEVLKQDNPQLFARLKSEGYVTEEPNGTLAFNGPQGVACLEPLTSVRQLMPQMLTPQTKTALSQDSNYSFLALEQLEQLVYQKTFQYELERPKRMLQSPRRLSSRTSELREQVKQIVELPVEGMDEPQASQYKYQQVLNLLESHYTKLVLAEHNSEFRWMLKDILLEHGNEYQVTYDANIIQSAVAGLVHGLMTIVKELLGLALNLGYLGGALVSGIGIFMHDVGRRLEHVIGDFGSNIALDVLKSPIWLVAKVFQVVGFIVSQNFGLKPLAKVVDDGMRDMRDSAVSAIDGYHVEKVEDPNEDHFRDFKDRFKHMVEDAPVVLDDPELENEVDEVNGIHV